jgi:acetoin utilization protein AcuB
MGAGTKTDDITVPDIEANRKDIGPASGTANEQFRLIDVIDDLSAGKDVFFQSVRVAKDIMKKNITTLTLDDKVEACLNFMRNNKVRHVPIMDPPTEKGGKPHFVGVVSGRDLSRLMSPYLGKVGEQDADRKALREPLGAIVTRHPVFVSPETAIKEVIFKMIHNHIDMVPVLVSGDLVGIITSADILHLLIRLQRILQLFNLTGEPEKANAARKKMRLIDMNRQGGGSNVSSLFSSAFQTAEDVMTGQPVCLGEQDTLSMTIEVMQKGKLRHVPIVNTQRRLVGLVSDRNVLRHLSPAPKQRPSRTEDEGFRTRLFAADPKDPNLSLPLTRIMTKDIVCVLPSCGFFNAIGILHENRISCLLVVDEEENLLGVVTVTDVMRALFTAYEMAEKSQPKSLSE